MGNKKNNQSKQFFSYKNDEVDLVEIGQFLRDTTKYRVEREWYVIFNKHTGVYMGYSAQAVVDNVNHKVRNPDLLLIDKDINKIVLIIEIDGSVHDVHYDDTEKRNAQYEYAKLPLLVIQKSEIETTIFDLVSRKVGEYLDN